ncbi:MAG: hypothetical protein WAK13_19470, partial [Terriglobales bacterium]
PQLASLFIEPRAAGSVGGNLAVYDPAGSESVGNAPGDPWYHASATKLFAAFRAVKYHRARIALLAARGPHLPMTSVTPTRFPVFPEKV